MKLYTRGGDRGETSLLGGRRVRKDSPRVDAYGEVDELNAVLGTIRAGAADAGIRDRLLAIQSVLFDLGGELATPDAESREAAGKPVPRVCEEQVERLERWIDELQDEVPPLDAFVLPGGDRAAAELHFARAICRRAERRVVALADGGPMSETPIRYLNRLSDLLFAMARAVNARAGIEEPTWGGRKG